MIARKTTSAEPSGVDRAPPYPTLAPLPSNEKRDATTTQPGSETCGYRTDAQFRPFACGAGLTCTNSNNVRACCTDCQHSTFGTGCLDATHTLCVDKTAEHRMQYCCTDFVDVPYCATYLWSTTTETRSVYTLYICESTAQRGVQILAAEPRPPNGRGGPSEPRTTSTQGSSSIPGAAESTGPLVGVIVGDLLPVSPASELPTISQPGVGGGGGEIFEATGSSASKIKIDRGWAYCHEKDGFPCGVADEGLLVELPGHGP
ncbi:hypothetical protein MAPG_06086 [Magnaporthiopsis poae ATCC 64411]|uniref:Uncharacterized protein n=1 Tax=Magnaporthiopsis poae (strain ATCC 64411 / 73-15) TaxID=644358 RepID=A0A0C4E141_MAGP6|nr:hypothetical protein MAPG_06086 [Magnaporthiopsis poae ATCC 64411]